MRDGGGGGRALNLLSPSSPSSFPFLPYRVVTADPEPEHEAPDHQPDRKREAAHGRRRRRLSDRRRDHDDKGQEVHRFAALFVAQVAACFCIG